MLELRLMEPKPLEDNKFESGCTALFEASKTRKAIELKLHFDAIMMVGHTNTAKRVQDEH